MRFSSLSILAIAAAVPAMSNDAQDAVLLEEIIISGGLTPIARHLANDGVIGGGQARNTTG